MAKKTGAAVGLTFAAGEPVDIPAKFLSNLIRNPRDRVCLDTMRRGEWIICNAPQFPRANAETALYPKPDAKFDVRIRWMHYLRWRAYACAREARGWTLATAVGVLRWAGPSLEVRDALVTENLGLVHKMAQRAPANLYPDFVAEGSLALVRAIDRFDWTRGIKFSSYACTAIIRSFSPDRKGIIPATALSDVDDVDPGVKPNGPGHVDAKDELSAAMKTVPAHDRGMLRKLYGIGNMRERSVRRVAADYGMTPAGIHAWRERTITRMRERSRASG